MKIYLRVPIPKRRLVSKRPSCIYLASVVEGRFLFSLPECNSCLIDCRLTLRKLRAVFTRKTSASFTSIIYHVQMVIVILHGYGHLKSCFLCFVPFSSKQIKEKRTRTERKGDLGTFKSGCHTDKQ